MEICNINLPCLINYHMEKLSEVKRGKCGKLVEIDEYLAPNIKRRMLELGLTNGQKVRIARKSILNKVLLIEIRGYMLSIRKNIAGHIWVESL